MARDSALPLFALPADDLAHILRHASAELEGLRGKSLFLTGGTGFFGKWLLAALGYADVELGLGLGVTVLSRDPDAFCGDIQRWRAYAQSTLSGDMSPMLPRRATLRLHSPCRRRHDGLYHRGRGRGTLARSPAGTKRVLDLTRESGARRMLHVSSGAVYGAFASQLSGAKEDDAASAKVLIPYGEAKRQAERICEESGVDFVMARAFAFLGPDLALDAHFAAGNFLRDALRGGPICVRGDGTALRSYLYPADLVVWLLRILVRGRRGRAYNVGSDEAVTTAQLAHLIAATMTPALEVVIQSVQPQGPQNVYLPDISRARTELNLDVVIPLREAIARTKRFLKQD